ncbi:sigma-70 family RNA polymerase sigma factor [Streptomyces phaeochromogenes]|uniref:RNA polymerase sigma factor n=1 Tax=Streptomyces phaeochromogenes TaxID=1923 RepID=UPI0033F82F3E
MTARKDQPRHHLAATDEEFDVLLEVSSLGAPHVVAESTDIPTAARHRMAQALQHQQGLRDTPNRASRPQLSESDHHLGVPADEEEPTSPGRIEGHGNHGDFEGFAREEHRHLVRFLLTLGASWEEAEDVVGEVLSELLLGWDQIKTPRTYCRLVAERVWVRSAFTLRKAPEAMARGAWTTPTQQKDSDSHGQPERDDTLQHLRLLNQEQRRVMAYSFDGYTPDEIAALLDKHPGVVRSNIRHARKRLKDALAAGQARQMCETTNRPGAQIYTEGS